MTRKAGSIVINRLRDRIRLGRYFGRWQPGDRLPSVRDVAAVEAVDRKTAAAAYRRLQKEGLVRVEPRSGVYLKGEEDGDADPLRRLHLSWLDRTLVSAEELGLEAETVHRMFQGVSAVKRRRIPVVDRDAAHATVLARELSERTGLECVSAQPEQLPAEVGPLRDPPFVIATLRGAEGLKALRGVAVVRITLAAELFEEVCAAALEAPVLVVVGSPSQKTELEQALDRGLAVHPERVVIARPRYRGDLAEGADPSRDGSRRVLIWPGSPDWVSEVFADGVRRPSHLVAASTVEEIRCQVARAALDHVSTSSAAAMRT